MKHTDKLMTIVIMTLITLSLSSTQVQAIDNNDAPALVIDIITATYLDLDHDNYEDDILTTFVIDTPPGSWEIATTTISCEIELPSGTVFTHNLVIAGGYQTIIVSIGWYNTATESGWYSFNVVARPHGEKAPTPGCNDILFDPPTEGPPGDPIIHTITVLVQP